MAKTTSKNIPDKSADPNLSDDNQQTSQDLPDGYEVLVGDDTQQSVEDAQQFAEELISLRNLIQRYADQMEKLSAEVKEHNDSLKNLMSNDQELSQLEEQAKAITTDLRAKQQRIKESPESVQIQVKVKELKEELSELKAALNNYLLRYYQMTGSTVIEDDTGDEREIVFQAKLGRKKSA